MYTTSMTKEKLLDNFDKGVYCAQSVFAEFAPQLGVDRQTALRIASNFASGINEGATCGAVTGALMAIGLKYGQGDDIDRGKWEAMLEKAGRLKQRMIEKHGSYICRELLGHKLPEEIDAVNAEKKFETVCSSMVVDACEICAELLNEE